MGPRAIPLICKYWDRLSMIAKYGGYYGAPIKVLRRVTQGGQISPTIFNVVVDTALCHWVAVVEESKETVPPGADSTKKFGRDVQRMAAYF